MTLSIGKLGCTSSSRWTTRLLMGLTAVAIIGCGQNDHRNYYKLRKELKLDILEPFPGLGYVHPAFRRYVSRFEKASGRQIMDRIVVDFGDTDSREAAHCVHSALGPSIGVARITVSKHYWNKYDADYERELIIFHELGHCVLGRDHVRHWGGIVSLKLNTQTCAPLSIMYPEADWTLLDTYQRHREFYVNELVGKKVNDETYRILTAACSYTAKDAPSNRKGVMHF